MSRSDNRELFKKNYRETKANFDGKFKSKMIKYSYSVSLTETLNPKIPKIITTMEDCVDDLVNYSTGKCLLINSGSMKKPGGGVKSGAGAQEEHLCRKSDLYHYLEKSNEKIEWPLHDKGLTGLYFKDVEFGSVFTDVLTLFSRPGGRNTFDLHYLAFKTLVYWVNKEKIDTVFLVPIGCGVFKHDPFVVAQALEKVLNEYECHAKCIYVSCFHNENNYKKFLNKFK